MTSSACAVVAAHGSLAEGLVSAVSVISGRGDGLRAVSNAGLGPAELGAAIERALDETGASTLFTDLPGGSCTLAARRLQRERPGLVVVTGVNLPTLLEFVMRNVSDEAGIADALARGRDQMKIVPEPRHVG